MSSAARTYTSRRSNIVEALATKLKDIDGSGAFLTDVGTSLGTAFSDVDWSKYSIKSQFTKVWDAITGFFTFDFTMPNFRDFLPTWLGGKGKSIGSSDSSSTPSPAETISSSEVQSSVESANTLESARAAVNSVIDIPNLK